MTSCVADVSNIAPFRWNMSKRQRLNAISSPLFSVVANDSGDGGGQDRVRQEMDRLLNGATA
jgi:hypothetical protein